VKLYVKIWSLLFFIYIDNLFPIINSEYKPTFVIDNHYKSPTR